MRREHAGTAVHALFERLEAEGVDAIFGVPGGPLTGFFEALRERGSTRFVLAKHEQGAGFMANAYARVKRHLSVVVGSSGPGATNLVTAVASARADSLPVLVLTGQVAVRTFGKGAFQESTLFGTDVVEIFKPLTKFSAMVPSAERLPQYLDQAIRRACGGRPGPVHLSLPADVLKQPTRSQPVALTPLAGPTVDLAGAQAAAQRLARARNPVILAGHGVALSSAEPELRRLAERLGAPVVTTPKGKGCFPETHPLSLGVYGLGGHPRAFFHLLSGAVDVTLVVGSSMGEFSSCAWDDRAQPRECLIQVDVDPAELGRNFPVQLPVCGDARAALTAIADALEGQALPRAGFNTVEKLRAELPPCEFAELCCDARAPLAPQRLMQELRAAMPDDGRLFVDIGNAMLWGAHYFEVRQPGTYFIDLGLASMGSAVAGVIGAKLADPSRPAVALVGDSAFAMNGMEVHTAAEQGLNAVWVVLNNAGHGMITQGERILRGADLGTGQFRHVLDCASIARGLGANGVRVRSPSELRRALNEALRADGPTVIDAEIDPTVVPPTLSRRAEALARYLGLPLGTPLGPAGDAR